jgi:hypothetical protein
LNDEGRDLHSADRYNNRATLATVTDPSIGRFIRRQHAKLNSLALWAVSVAAEIPPPYSLFLARAPPVPIIRDPSPPPTSNHHPPPTSAPHHRRSPLIALAFHDPASAPPLPPTEQAARRARAHDVRHTRLQHLQLAKLTADQQRRTSRSHILFPTCILHHPTIPASIRLFPPRFATHKRLLQHRHRGRLVFLGYRGPRSPGRELIL